MFASTRSGLGVDSRDVRAAYTYIGREKSSIGLQPETRRMPTGMYVYGLNEPSSSSGTAPAMDCNIASPKAG